MNYHTMTLAESQLKHKPITKGDHIPAHDTRILHTNL